MKQYKLEILTIHNGKISYNAELSTDLNIIKSLFTKATADEFVYWYGNEITDIHMDIDLDDYFLIYESGTPNWNMSSIRYYEIKEEQQND